MTLEACSDVIQQEEVIEKSNTNENQPEHMDTRVIKRIMIK